MEFDLNWLLIGLPLAFALGWLASRFDLRQWRLENRQAPKAYFKGLNYLLNEQQDQAIDAFIEAVQRDSDTSELHFALGNLFRRRGEYQRAVRVHEHLLSRADLSAADRERAQYALALDFLKAGLIDRAEDALQKLHNTHYAQQAALTLLSIHERARDWIKAGDVARELQAQGQGDFSGRLAHYLCEQAEATRTKTARDKAPPTPDQDIPRSLLDQAIALAPAAARPRIQLAGWFAAQGDVASAFDALMQLPAHAPQFIPLVARELVRLGAACGKVDTALAALEASCADTPSVDVTDAIVQALAAQGVLPEVARARYVYHMAQEPSLIAAARWLTSETFAHEADHPTIQRTLDHAVRPLARYRCAACGFEAQGYFWQCPGCQAWESFPPRRIEEL
ncbi:MAG: lipopolysaccharide assembly protein LapB [Burkholderiaceae bacterium]|nr:lipopolysaccharide assembly protein LapB [Burkholderiaceae bacterium]